MNADVANPYPQRTEGYLSLNGDLFSLPSGSTGSTLLCYNATTQSLSDRTDFGGLPGAPPYGVLGYPESILGENIYGGATGAVNAVLPLPHDRIVNMTSRNLWVDLNYSVSAPGASPYDFAFDDWFSATPANSTSSGNVGNRIELMVWFSNNIGMYLGQTPVAVPSYLNGSAAPGTWFRDQLCQGSDEITFDYLYAPSGTTPGYGVASGQVALNLTYLLNDVAQVMQAGACWASPGTDIGALFADNFPLGAEFYPTSLDTAEVSWAVSSLCYRFVTGVANATSVSCGGTLPPGGGPPSSGSSSTGSPLFLEFTSGFILVGAILAVVAIRRWQRTKGT